MEDQKTRGERFEKFTWTIKDLSKLNTNNYKKKKKKLKINKIYSEIFSIGGHPWRILVYPKGNNVDFLSIYLDAATFPVGWSRFAKFKLVLINQVHGKKTITKETQHTFNARENDWGFTLFMPLAEFYDPKKGFIVDDTCIIEAVISVSNSDNEIKVDQAVSPVSAQVPSKPSEHSDTPLPMEISSDPIGELMDFRDLGKIEKAFIPLLEEVCSRYPSLIECQQTRTPRFTEWAFTALGRVLHFLKTKKVKDMNADACNHLQILWEELETCRFDLTWLKPHVQSALGLKSYMERAVQVKSMKENVAALKMEMKRHKAKLAATNVDLEIARKELVKAEEGFEERNLDAELGYGP